MSKQEAILIAKTEFKGLSAVSEVQKWMAKWLTDLGYKRLAQIIMGKEVEA